jgi:hypothetical protein
MSMTGAQTLQLGRIFNTFEDEDFRDITICGGTTYDVTIVSKDNDYGMIPFTVEATNDE